MIHHREHERIVIKGQHQCFLSSKTQSNQYPAPKVLRRSSEVAIAKKIQVCCKPPCLLLWIAENISQLVAFGKTVLLAFNTSSSIFISNIRYLTCRIFLSTRLCSVTVCEQTGFTCFDDCRMQLHSMGLGAIYATCHITCAAPAPAPGNSLHPGRYLKPACCVQRHSFSWSFAIGLCCKVQFKFKPLFLGPIP